MLEQEKNQEQKNNQEQGKEEKADGAGYNRISLGFLFLHGKALHCVRQSSNLYQFLHNPSINSFLSPALQL